MESQQHALEILMDLCRLVAAQGEFLAKFGQHTEEAPESLAEHSPPHQPWNTRPPDQQPVTGPQRGWSLPPSVTTAPLGIKPEALPRLRLEPQHFYGEHALDWIGKIQRYYNHHYTLLDDRLYLTKYLFDHPASDWREYWVETNKGKSWDDFLLAVKHRFDPGFYKPYAATVSFGPFRRPGGTGQDQRQPIRATANPIANQEPDSQPLHRIEEVKQTIMVVKEHNADGDLIDQSCSEALHMASEIIVGDDIKGVGYDAEQFAQVQALTEPILPREVSTDRVDEEIVNKGISSDLGAQSGVSKAITSSSFNANSLGDTNPAEEVLPTWDPGASAGNSCFETKEERNVEDSATSFCRQFGTSDHASPVEIVTGKVESDNSKVRENMRANGGLREDDFPLITDGGIDTEIYYPYTGTAATSAINQHLARVVSINWYYDDTMTKEGQTYDSRWVNPPKPPSLDRSSDVDSMIATLEEYFEIPPSCLLCIGLDHVVHRRCDPSYYTIYLEETREYKLHEDEHGKDFVQCVAFSNKVRIFFKIMLFKVHELYSLDLDKFSVVDVHSGALYYTKTDLLLKIGLLYLGRLLHSWWNDENKSWHVAWLAPSNEYECDIYETWGQFRSCYTQALKMCSCLKRFNCQMMKQLQYNVGRPNVQEFWSRCWGSRSCIAYGKVLMCVMIFVTWCCIAMVLTHELERLFDAFVQGAQEFKNEVIVVTKFRHNNLVQSLEYGVGKKEKMVIYEFMPHDSLDSISHFHLEDKVVFNGGRVDRVLDLVNLAEDHLQYLLFYLIQYLLF